ncbi:hypothetical protein [Sinorhizobium americanum]|uniref:Transmembrane protein n=1 Tax=Sinorhizobium americanum TaxID=194963 RepID=A0A4R2AYE1_9HYPH|nr:hypothetical protein [Sinorhizobium americanum]APG84649.1 hypothetical protein SAMCCGM7_Ch1904 [Sinorhizobium americanum CCGM7]TCN18886.1 hypothetical protein EV184_13230 [Sinorhizobium americanum]
MSQYETENHFQFDRQLREAGKRPYRVISRAEARRSWISLALAIAIVLAVAAFILPTAF